MFKQAGKLLNWMTRADMAFYLLPPLMLLLTIGTIAQKPMGLYAAQKMFFASFIVWAGPLPLPGGYTLIGLLSLSLLAKFLLRSDWSWRRAGVNLTHLGILILLFGGLSAALQSRESFMIIPEGVETAYTYDYHQRILYIFENDTLKQSIPFKKLHGKISGLPFEIEILNTCKNCNITKRTADGEWRGMAQFMALETKTPDKEPEADIPGLTFTINGLTPEENGTYIAFEGMPKPVILQAGKREYKIIFGKQQDQLPFSIRLDDFKKESYPGTDKARAYSSDIVILDGGVEWPARIEMNAPLRYKGYTFYQSSFGQSDSL
ncbi:MAG: cytochrome c biogenesis protein ResB, partial [Alphaproteobacteria bacterium]